MRMAQSQRLYGSAAESHSRRRRRASCTRPRRVPRASNRDYGPRWLSRTTLQLAAGTQQGCRWSRWEGGAEMSAKQEPGRRIIVGVDGSPSSKAALSWAVRQAEETDATVEAVIAWHYPVMVGGVPRRIRQRRRGATPAGSPLPVWLRFGCPGRTIGSAIDDRWAGRGRFRRPAPLPALGRAG